MKSNKMKIQVNNKPTEREGLGWAIHHHVEEVVRSILEKTSAGQDLSEAIMSLQQDERDYRLTSLRSSVAAGPMNVMPKELQVRCDADAKRIAALYVGGECKDSLHVQLLQTNQRVIYGFVLFFDTELRGETHYNSIAVEVPAFKKISRRQNRKSRRKAA